MDDLLSIKPKQLNIAISFIVILWIVKFFGIQFVKYCSFELHRDSSTLNAFLVHAVNIVALLFAKVVFPVPHLAVDVIKWKHFPRNWPFVREIHRSPVNFPLKGQWRGALMFSLIYAWINDWVNNREAGDLRRQHGHYDVIVMNCENVLLLLIKHDEPKNLTGWIYRQTSNMSRTFVGNKILTCAITLYLYPYFAISMEILFCSDPQI